MYDKYSLGLAFIQSGFSEINQVDVFNSCIADWDRYTLDVRDGIPHAPSSLVMEGRKINKQERGQ
jgi:hypothetical protein